MRLPIRSATLHALREIRHNFTDARWPKATTPRITLLSAVAMGTLAAGALSAAQGADASDLVGASGSPRLGVAVSQTAPVTAAEVSTQSPVGDRRAAGRIAYHAYVKHIPTIFTIRPDGSRTRQLTHNDTGSNAPAWSPGGQKIVFGRADGNDNELVIMKRDGTDKHQITHNQTIDINPDWSPSGARIAYACGDRDFNFEICTIRTDGTHRRVLTDNDAYDNQVDWSPTGKRIAFGSDRDGDFEIYTMRPDGTHVRQVTHNTTDDDNPSFSPSGRRIAYQGASRGGDGEIFIKRTNGQGVRLAVTHNTRDSGQPAWSPAGGRIAYIEDNGTSFDVYTIKVSGDARHQVTHTRIDENLPDWGPRPGQ
jgi:Tol biopolymer transport system component